MPSWIEPPPKQKKVVSLAKRCLLIAIFLILLGVAFDIGFYAGTKPKEIPQVQTTEDEQNAVRARWDEFEASSRNEQVVTPPLPQPSPTPDVTPALEATPIPTATVPSPNRIELTAADINALIARG